MRAARGYLGPKEMGRKTGLALRFLAPAVPIFGRIEIACGVVVGQRDIFGWMCRDNLTSTTVAGQFGEKPAQAGVENDRMAGGAIAGRAAKDQVIGANTCDEFGQVNGREFRKIGQ